ncbi:Do family serine endopeptidase [Marinicella rhabdoformis]|uniref:Do family serine endopeptidase n=1 Tax=Marinicella rhabdoformis TaxID=2580566 RepID=UPI0012AEC534|nr:Do family serine endopeptidase [Marinicella rhabdoformis]
MKKHLMIWVLLMPMVLHNVHAKEGGLPDFTSLVKDTSSAVVNIVARENADEQNKPLSQQEEQLYRFFGMPGQPQNRDRVSGGSGFIISTDGYILTNRHVIQGADKVTVTLKDRRELDAEIVGEDEASDVAVLKVDAKNLPILEVGTADKLQIGEWVMAIGSPLSFEHSVTKGIISAKGRRMGNQQYVPYLQSDVPINRGNSGGPLINMSGKVVGINTLIVSNTGGYMGISFSIPIEVAMNVADQLRSHGTVKRGLLGVGIEDVNQEMADYLGMAKPSGALVNNVSKDSAAEKAGIEVGDVIVEFNNKTIIMAESLPPVVGMTMPETGVEVKVFRDGKVKTLKASLDALEPGLVASNGGDDKAYGKGLGFTVGSLTEQLQERSGETEGVVVKSVDEAVVRRAGLRVGDIIKKVGKVSVSNLKGFKAAVADLEEDEPLVLLVRQGAANRFIVIER